MSGNLLENCTTPGRRKRHYADDLRPDRHAPRQAGRGGRTLCGQSAEDEERANAPQWWSPDGYQPPIAHPRKQIRIANLPLCASCERSRVAFSRSEPS